MQKWIKKTRKHKKGEKQGHTESKTSSIKKNLLFPKEAEVIYSRWKKQKKKNHKWKFHGQNSTSPTPQFILLRIMKSHSLWLSSCLLERFSLILLVSLGKWHLQEACSPGSQVLCAQPEAMAVLSLLPLQAKSRNDNTFRAKQPLKGGFSQQRN